VVRKPWGFYLTNSLNGTLQDQGIKTALVENRDSRRTYVMLVDQGRLAEFNAYLAEYACTSCAGWTSGKGADAQACRIRRRSSFRSGAPHARNARCGGRAGSDTAREGGVAVTLAGTLFQPGSAEALLEIYLGRGIEAALAETNGDFALAILDEHTGTAHIARDRFGVRPLYYWRSGERLAFASRLRSLLTLAEVPRDIDRRFAGLFAGSHYRTFDNAPERSPLPHPAGPAAHYLTWKDGKFSLRRYWTLDAEQDWLADEDELAERYRELLLDAVRIRFTAVPKAAFALSGGMDSSSVLACAVRNRGERQHAFSTVYRDPTFDESEDIKPILDATVQQWRAVQVNEPDVHCLVKEMVAAHDEPVATATWLAHYVMCREVKRQDSARCSAAWAATS